MIQDLGSLTLVEARGVWRNEALDFTPWLAQEENIAKLGDALGLEMEVESIEVAVGPYWADILARDTASGSYVVIENQLEKIDHDHVGKALTYAAVLDAEAVIWIATEFTEEHRRAIDWLNDKGSGDISFYAVRLEVWRIGDSKPAVRFNVLSRPAEAITAIQTRKAAGDLTETRQRQLDWWTYIRDALLAKKVVPSVQTPRPQYWYDVALGRTGFHLSCIADTYANRIGVRLYMVGRFGGQEALALLLKEKENIEAELGHQVQWDPNPDRSDKIILSARSADLAKKEQWPEYAEWLVAEIQLFRQVFRERIRVMDVTRPDREGDPDAGGENGS